MDKKKLLKERENTLSRVKINENVLNCGKTFCILRCNSHVLLF